MDEAIPELSRLQIRHFHVRYLVSRDHPAPERLRARLDEAVTHSLTHTLSSILSRSFSDADTSVWLIRRLEIELDVNAAWERESLTRAWAQQVALTLHRILQDGADGENVRWFPNRAAYVARFLVEAAQGYAWNRWYYESFAGLRPLQTSVVLRTAICEQPAIGLAALHQLPLDELGKVLRALTAQDARRILDSFAAAGPAGEELRSLQAARTAWEAAEWDPYDDADEARNALRLYLEASRDRTDVGGPHLKTAVLTVARVPPSRISHHAVEPDDLPAGPRDTVFGGTFFLLPVLDELPLAEATEGWPDLEEAASVALVRFILLVKCCGQARAHRVFYDPLLRDLMKIPPSISPIVLTRWHKGISAANQNAFLETLASWHHTRGSVTRERQILARVTGCGEPVAVLLDGERGIWLFARGFQSRRPEPMHKALQSWLSQDDRKETILLSDPVFVELLRSALPDQKLMTLLEAGARIVGEEYPQIAQILARLDKLPDDLSYLSLPGSFGLARSLDLTLSIAAHGVMRSFAWRLPGFAGSNLPYLFSNFLNFSGSIEEEPERRVVRIGRPPLHLILSMNGMTRQTYRLSWLDERPLALFQEA
ncbi:MAG TPA: hypothetical protein VGL91_00165 [Acidobacteriota bacterium]